MKKKRKVALLGIILFLIVLSTTLTVALSIKKDATSLNDIDSSNKETIVIDDNQIQETINIELSTDIDLEEKREEFKNNDIVARLEIPDLFNILIVQGNNNEFYLNHNLYRKKDVKGTEYIDYRVNTESKQINIYGHNSRTYDIPFKKLEKFLDEEFFNTHEYIVLQTLNSKRVYRIFSIKEDNGNYEHMKVTKTGKEFKEHINTLKSNSIYTREVKFDEDSNLLILQTCTYGKKNTFYIISAIEIKNYT